MKKESQPAFRFTHISTTLRVFPVLALPTLFLIVLVQTLANSPTAYAQGNIVYVNHNATGANNGSSWTDAFTDFQAALDAAQPGDEVWVAQGVYTPTNASDRTATFQMKTGMALYGGFVGTETLRTQRDWVTHATILSGDLDGNDLTDSQGIVTDTDNIVGDNAYHVVFSDGVTETAILDGFIITAGKSDRFNEHWYRGGGLHNYGGTPTLRNLIFSGNEAHFGGGMASWSSSPTMINLTFVGNRAHWYDGGGLSTLEGSPVLINVTFKGNRASRRGGGMSSDGSDGGSPTLINVIFSGNQANEGGGLHNLGNNAEMINITLSGNQASEGGGILNYGSSPLLANCILWGNDAVTGTQIHNTSFSTPTIRYSVVESSGGSGGNWDSSLGIDGGNNLDADPAFVAPTAAGTAPTTIGDYRLLSQSPAIDSGDTLSVTVASDLDGKPRIMGNSVDMGAYETPYYTLTVALTGTGTGIITSFPPGIFCSIDTCSHDFVSGALVFLTATSVSDSFFIEWSGACSGSDSTCPVMMNSSKNATATFVRYQVYLPLIAKN